MYIHVNFIAIRRDVMGKKELEKKSERVRSEYDSFMRHELKNFDADTNVCRNNADD